MTNVKSPTQTHILSGKGHAVVWIDHHEARIFRFDSDVTAARHHVIRDEASPAHLHHKANERGSGHAQVSHDYLEKVATDVADARAILILGPSSAKHELYKHIEQRHAALCGRIVGVESIDHPGDGPLLKHATESFRAAERLGRPYSPHQT